MKKMMEVVYVDAIDGFDDGVSGERREHTKIDREWTIGYPLLSI